MSYDYQKHFVESAQAYVDKHKADPAWVDKMIQYYIHPDHPCRRHEYTNLVLNILLATKSLGRYGDK